MAQYTKLSVFGVPGKPHSFSPKTEAPTGGPHTGGPFTKLSVIAIPGKPHSFSAKDPATVGGPHTGLFTKMSVLALPGRRRSYLAKTLYVPEEPETPEAPPIVSIGGGGQYDWPERQEARDWLKKRGEIKEIEELHQMILAFLEIVE